MVEEPCLSGGTGSHSLLSVAVLHTAATTWGRRGVFHLTDYALSWQAQGRNLEAGMDLLSPAFCRAEAHLPLAWHCHSGLVSSASTSNLENVLQACPQLKSCKGLFLILVSGWWLWIPSVCPEASLPGV